jgi:6-pyruvoyltetrahydropterin/6-carboxytetrahydropterin synthase
MIALTRRYQFSAAHRLHASSLSDEANREIFGKCNNPYGHGHNYVLEVTVAGPVDRFGRAADVAALDQLVRQAIVDPFHHRNLNTDAPEFQHLVPTTENLAVVAEQRLRHAWPPVLPALRGVRIFETQNNIFEIGNL